MIAIMIMMKKRLFIPKMIMMQMTKFLTKMKVKITMKVTITKVSTKLKKRVEILKCGNLAKKACNSSPEQENQPKDTGSYIQYQEDAKRACKECYNNNIQKMYVLRVKNVTITTIRKMYVLRVKNKICPVIVFCF